MTGSVEKNSVCSAEQLITCVLVARVDGFLKEFPLHDFAVVIEKPLKCRKTESSKMHMLNIMPWIPLDFKTMRQPQL